MALTLVVGGVGAGTLWLCSPERSLSVPGGDAATSATQPVSEVSVEPPPSLGPTEALEIRHEGKRYSFHERRYTPPYRLTLHERSPDPSRLTSPEAALASLTSAMSHGDWDWWRQLWDREGRRTLADALGEADMTWRDMVAGWRQVYAGSRHVALRRIDFPGYVILYTRRENAEPDAPESRQPLALKQDADGRWWFTHDLQHHPLYFYDGDVRPPIEATPP